MIPPKRPAPRAARWIFWIAGVYGLLLLGLILLMPARLVGEAGVGRPENFYGFLTVGLAWQVAFLIIGADPVRHRPLMWAAVCEKFFYVAAIATLIASGRVDRQMAGPVALD